MNATATTEAPTPGFEQPDHHVPGARPRARGRLDDRPTEHLEAELLALSRQLHLGTYELLVLVGELDARGAWATWGALSCAAWLADCCDIERSIARTQVRVAAAMRAFPALDRVMACGDVSYAKARVLVAHLDESNVEALLAIAETTPAGRLGAAIAAWSTRNEDPEVIDRRHAAARSLSWRVEPDGMVVVTGKLPPLVAARVQAQIDQAVIRATAPAGASLGQQRADALVRLLERPEDRAAGTAEIVLHVRPDGNALADGTPLSDHAVAGLLPDAFVSLLITDMRRRPIDASPRRRFPTRRQRRVVDERNPECAHQGCHAGMFLQYDHIVPYSRGGPTAIDNLQRCCGPHNRARTGNASAPAGGGRRLGEPAGQLG